MYRERRVAGGWWCGDGERWLLIWLCHYLWWWLGCRLWSVEVWGGNKVAHNWKTVPSGDGLKIPLQPPRAAHQTLFIFTGLRMTQLLQFQWLTSTNQQKQRMYWHYLTLFINYDIMYHVIMYNCFSSKIKFLISCNCVFPSSYSRRAPTALCQVQCYQCSMSRCPW